MEPDEDRDSENGVRTHNPPYPADTFAKGLVSVSAWPSTCLNLSIAADIAFANCDLTYTLKVKVTAKQIVGPFELCTVES